MIDFIPRFKNSNSFVSFCLHIPWLLGVITKVVQISTCPLSYSVCKPKLFFFAFNPLISLCVLMSLLVIFCLKTMYTSFYRMAYQLEILRPKMNFLP